MAKKTISIVSPVFNEEDCIAEFVERLFGVISNIESYKFEIILVNDGSTDKTREILAEIRKNFEIDIVDLLKNCGQQVAIFEGIKKSRGEAVIVLDSDLQDQPEYIPELLNQWENEADVVMCIRKNREDNFFKKFTASVYYRILHFFDQESLVDCGDFYLIDRNIADNICKYEPKNLYLRGLVAKLGTKRKSIFIERKKRIAGSSKYTLLKMLKLAKSGLQFTLSKPKKPFKKERIAVIGGGISGLMTAYRLAQKGHKIVLFEKNEFLGGELSETKLATGNSVEKFYHHIFMKDEEAIKLFTELGIKEKIKWRKSRVAVLNKGEIYPFNTAIDLLRLPFLSLISKIRIGIFSIIIPAFTYKKFEKITSKQLITYFMGAEAWQKFWGPMFRLKFDDKANIVGGPWFWARLKDRASSRRDGEILGYPDGGFQILIDELARRLNSFDAKIKANHSISAIKKIDNLFQINGDFFDKVVCCTDMQSFTRIAPLELKEKSQLAKFEHTAVVVVLLETSEKISDYYWINVLDKNMPFGAMVEHTNLVSREEYGTNLIYLGRYIKETDPIYKMSDDEISKLFLSSLADIYPNIRDKVTKFYVYRDRFAQPVVPVNYQKPNIKTSIDGVFLFSSAHIYPQDRGLNNVLLGVDKVIDAVLYK